MNPRLVLRKAVSKALGYSSLEGLRERGLVAGRGVTIAGRTYIDSGFEWAVTLEDGVTLSHDVRIIAHDAAARHSSGYTAVSPVRVGEDAYIGAGTILLPGASVGERSIVGAGSVVTGPIPADTVAAGVPCKPIRSLDEFLHRHAQAKHDDNVFDLAPAQFAPSDVAAIQHAMQLRGIAYIR